ncbi:hypothetical protein [Bacillus thuringiensis]|uniref:hypothetical protein n=1 Tax=Bacillus thuringiensis TaxID=1428 RepID=UPI00211D570D|nr:hypothetical protein [Bacillus thuringiensis]
MAAIKIPIENVLKLLPLKLVIMNEFGVNFFANKKISNMSKRDKPMNIYIGNLHLHNKIIY